jgi:tRNA nucleotidyltransferase (CCA-adding enzyme)
MFVITGKQSTLEAMKNNIPQSVQWTVEQLQQGGFEGFLVGGCVRDLLINREPKDWDLTTNAVPEEIISIFEQTDRRVVYENNFGTVAIVNKDLESTDPAYSIEITPYRTEGAYSDSRRPDEVRFSKTIDEDLSRRDFTINAMAYDPINDTLVDRFDGQKDLDAKIIKTVGDPTERFSEDALRIIRAVRFSAQLGFQLDQDTVVALKELSSSLTKVSNERIRDELIKIFDAPYAMDAFIVMQKLGILEHIIPEFLEGVGCEQGGAHSYDVWTHLLKSLEHGTEKNYTLEVKIAALFHDIGKPRTRRKANGRGTKEWTFYGHEVVGARMTKDILERLRFPKVISEPVVKLVRYHMFFSDPDEITLSAVRRMVRNVGKDLIWRLMDLRTCDRIGTGRPKEKPYRLRKYHAMIEEVMRDPVSVSMLKINGDIMVQEMNIEPGRRMGWILHALLEEVLDDPSRNTLEYLTERTYQLNKLDSNELQSLGEAGKDKKEETDYHQIKKLHRKHKVD